MAKRYYIGAVDAVEAHLSDGRKVTLQRGEAVEVSDEVAQQMDDQPDNWASKLPEKSERKAA